MRKLFGFGPALLVIAMLVGAVAAVAWSTAPLPDGEVFITDLTNAVSE